MKASKRARSSHKRIYNSAQLEFTFQRPIELDRNFHLGGKSFYFFDFDDNVAYLSTPILVFHKETGAELALSSGQFARHNKKIGIEGPYKDYVLDFNDQTGSFRNFRDFSFCEEISKPGFKQRFVHDVEEALKKAEWDWKAPSWNCFYHATYNHRPLSLITARGHQANTIKAGIKAMVDEGHLPHNPNYLSIYAVSNPDTRRELGDHSLEASVAELKRWAIRRSVEQAISQYDYSPHHRFGMSDDDPHNVELITEEMKYLKGQYPEMSFFVIQTFKDSYIKREVLEHRTRDIISEKESRANQLNLFDL
jgi:hypothetical protein